MKYLLRKVNYRCNVAKALTPVMGVSRYKESDSAFDWSIHNIPANLELEKQPLVSGWYMLEAIMVASEQYLDCTLTVEYDDGAKRNHTFMAINQRIMKRVLLLKRGYQRITLVPSEKNLSFSVCKMSLVKLTTRAAYTLMLKKLLTYKPGHDYTRSLHLWRHYENLHKLQHKSEIDYQDWIDRREFNQLKRAFHSTQADKFCFIIDATNCVDLDRVSITLDSILCQTYTLWETIVITPRTITKPPSGTHKSGIQISSENVSIINASHRTNSLIKKLLNISDAKYYITAEPGTVFSPHALSVFARYQHEHPDSMFSYPDHDSINAQGERHSPLLKPDWNPDLMLSTNYIGSTVIFNQILFSLQEKTNQSFTSLSSWVYEVLIKAAINNSILPNHIKHILYHSTDTNTPPPPFDHRQTIRDLKCVSRHLWCQSYEN